MNYRARLEELTEILRSHWHWVRGEPGRRARLAGANLTRMDLAFVCLREADLSGADLTGADLRGADLTGADLTGAILTGALF